MMLSGRLLPLSTLLLAWASLAAADDTITAGKIKVQLYAAPSFLSEVSVDAYNNQCLSLDNNLYVATRHTMQRNGLLTERTQNRRSRAIYPRRRPRCRDRATKRRLLEL